MTRRTNISLLTGVVFALCVAGGPFRVSRVVAQEAIMLETIGAVRMATPEEARRISATASQPAPQRRPETAPQRHAAIAD